MFDVVIAGGGTAGLSAALMLGRSRRNVLVCAEGRPRNAPAPAAHNVFTRDGTPPLELLRIGREQLLAYDNVQYRDVAVIAAARHTDASAPGSVTPQGYFHVTLGDGSTVQARRLLLATGVADDLPPIPGLAELWGTSVFLCPYCHGWEVRDHPLAVINYGSQGVEQALMISQWTRDLVLCTDGPSDLTDEEVQRLSSRGIRVVEDKIARLEGENGALKRLVFENGETLPRDAAVIAPAPRQRSDLPAALGCTLIHPLPRFELIRVDELGYTGVPGVYAAGDAATVMHSVVMAAASAMTAAHAINRDLLQDELDAEHGHQAASHGHAAPNDTAGREDYWNELYRSRDALWSGNPNPQLVAEAAGLAPGSALDIGAGEGADAIWLAERGWRVTAVDISTVALERAATHAAARGEAVARRIDWLQKDITTWNPPEASYDLVSAQFVLHMPKEQREPLFRSLAAAVRHGGSLLVVGHDFSDVRTTIGRPHQPELFFTSSELAGLLDTGDWDVVVSETRGRDAVDAEGRTVRIHDAVVRAQRR